MDKDKFDINALALRPAIAIVLATLVVALLVDQYLLPHRGRIVGFSTSMALIAVYTAKPMLKHIGAKVFIVGYVLLHLAVIALPFTHDSDYAGAILLPFIIADYVLMVFALRWFTLRLAA